MIYFIVLLIIFLLLLCFIIVYLALKKSRKEFEINKRNGKAIVVGYSSDTTDSYIELMVKIPELNGNHSYNLKGRYNVKTLSGHTDLRYPYFNIGDEVEVIYAPQKIFGINMVDVWLRDDFYNLD